MVDAALEQSMTAKGISPRALGYRDDLNGRINAACDQGLLADSQVIHDLRRIRNMIAHEFKGNVSWSKLDETVQTVHDLLSALGFVGPMPNFDVRAERKKKQRLTDAKARIGFDYCVAVIADGSVVADIQWSEELLPPIVSELGQE